MSSIAWKSLNWRGIPKAGPLAAARTELERMDPNGKSPLTPQDYAKLSKEDQARAEEILKALSVLGAVPKGTRGNKLDRAGQTVESLSLKEKCSTDKRRYTDISTITSRDNVIQPLFPDSLAAPGLKTFKEEHLATMKSAKKFIFIQGYEISRQDIIDVLIERAKAGVQIGLLFQPADGAEGKTQEKLLKQMEDLKLPNVHVARFPLDSSRRQIHHIKKTFCDTPEGSICEVGGGINFNHNSVKNFDLGWRIDGMTAMDSLRHMMEDWNAAAGTPPFDLDALLPSHDTVRKKAATLARTLHLSQSPIEIGGSGSKPAEKPRDYTFAKLMERAKLGKKIIISSIEAAKPNIAKTLERAVRNGSPLAIVEEVMTPEQQAAFDKVKASFKGEEVVFYAHDARVIDSSYHKLVLRELDQAIANKESIDAAAFALSSDSIIQKLIAAKNAGCPVRVLCDDLQINGNAINRKSMAMLTAAGIEVKVIDEAVKLKLAAKAGSTPEQLKLHAKLMILGGDRILAGSANFSASGMGANIEDGRLIRSPQTAQAVTRHLFDRLWSEASVAQRTERVAETSRDNLLASVPPSTPIKDITFVVFDLETVGLRPEHDGRILQYGYQAIRAKADGTAEVLGSGNDYVLPGKDVLGNPYVIPPEITSLTGISDKTLERNGAKHVREAQQKFVEFIREQQKKGPVVLVGQNVEFDLRFVDYTLSRKQLAVKVDGKEKHLRFDASYVDTIDLSYKLFPNDTDHNLDAQMSRLGIPSDPSLPRHDGFADVVYTARILAKGIAKGGFKTLGELLGEDTVRFLGPTLVESASGTVGHQLSFNDKGKLIVQTKDTSTGKYDDGKRVGRVYVEGHQGDKIKIRVAIGTGQNEKFIDGFVPVKNVQFKSGGKVLEEMRQTGVKIERPDIISCK